MTERTAMHFFLLPLHIHHFSLALLGLFLGFFRLLGIFPRLFLFRRFLALLDGFLGLFCLLGGFLFGLFLFPAFLALLDGFLGFLDGFPALLPRLLPFRLSFRLPKLHLPRYLLGVLFLPFQRFGVTDRQAVVFLVQFAGPFLVFGRQAGQFIDHRNAYIVRLKFFHQPGAQVILDCLIPPQLRFLYPRKLRQYGTGPAFQAHFLPQFHHQGFRLQYLFHLLPVRLFPEAVCKD